MAQVAIRFWNPRRAQATRCDGWPAIRPRVAAMATASNARLRAPANLKPWLQ